MRRFTQEVKMRLIYILLDSEALQGYEEKNSEYPLMVIFDDIDVTKRNDKVAELFTQGRHYNTVKP